MSMVETGPDSWKPRVVYLFDTVDHCEIGEVICLTDRDLKAIEYALRYTEYIGYEIHEYAAVIVRTNA